MDVNEIKSRIEYLRAQIERAARLYYEEDAPEISDYEYDAMFRELQELEAERLPEVPGWEKNRPLCRNTWQMAVTKGRL